MTVDAVDGNLIKYQKLKATSFLVDGQREYHLRVTDQDGQVLVDLDTSKGDPKTQIFQQLMKWRCYISAALVMKGWKI